MNEDQFNQESNQFSGKMKDAGRRAKGILASKPGKKAARAAGKAISGAAKALIRAIFVLLKALLPWILIGLVLLGMVAAIWDWGFEERGSSGAYDLQPDQENVIVQDSNEKFTAAALTKNQAYVNAYYKYMSCSSYSKTVGGSDVFTFRDTTADFAGLQDYYEKENFFYLSPSFIKMADERLNDDEFFYPEQIIKPVDYELTADGHVQQVPLTDDHGALQAKSKAWNSTNTNQTNTEVLGTWDYGLGSMLKYNADVKEKFIDCEYTQYQFDVDQISLLTGTVSHVTVRTVNIPSGSDVNDVMSQYDSVKASLEDTYSNLFYRAQVTGPDRETLKAMVEEQHHINMWLEEKDIAIGQRSFDSPELQAFSNSTEKYPINIPLIDSVATFSGNITYEYTPYQELSEIHDVGDLISQSGEDSDTETNGQSPTSADGVPFSDPAQPINRVWVNNGVSPCSAKTEFWVSRTGDVKTITPVLAGEETDPVGDEYLRDYANAYVTYVPQSVASDYDFSKRIEEDSTNRELLQELGLIVPYGGVMTEGANYNVFATTGLSASDFDILLQGTALEGKGQMWVNLESKYGVNAIFGIAVAYQESGFGTSALAKNKNNLFGLNGSNGWMRFDSVEDCVDYFGHLISSSSLYANKTIDEISRHYCTSGPEGWAKAVKSLMASRYADLMEAGVDVGAVAINPTYSAVDGSGTISQEEVDAKIAQMGLSYDDLFENVNFDVLVSTSMLQNLSGDGEQENGMFSWLGKLWDSLSSMISGFFEDMGNIFVDNSIYEGEHVRYGTPIAEEDIDDIVYQTITFATGTLYSNAYNSIDRENLGFLFVGKEAMYGYGTYSGNMVLVPGVGTNLDGFISPTEEYYQPLTGWSAAAGGVELSVPAGTKVLSVADNGTVTSVLSNGAGNGYTVKVSYRVDGKTYGVEFRYLKSVNVSEGSSVNSGDLIGISGTKPDGTPCLFFGFTNSDGRNVDPLDYFYQPTYSNLAIVEVAKSQVGNQGGMIYKTWYGLHPTDSWCAAFVSWCADQCGYIDANVFPMFASCGDGINNYFKPNGIYWSASQGTFIPSPGNLVFFDWEHDGVQDHVGIVEKYENGIIYTIEGNSSNAVKERTYALNSPDIYGFAFPDYVTKIFKK